MPSRPRRPGPEGPKPPGPPEPKGRNLLLLAMAVLGVLIAAQLWAGRGTSKEIRYDEFKRRVRAGEVAEVIIGTDVIRGRTRKAAAPPSKAPRPSALGKNDPVVLSRIGPILNGDFSS